MRASNTKDLPPAPSFLARARKSETWKAIHDLVALREIYALLASSGLFGALGAISAAIRGEPLHVVLLWGFAIAAATFAALYFGLKVASSLKERKSTQQALPVPVPEKKNLTLISSGLSRGVFGLENDVWVRNPGPGVYRYQAWILTIRNEPIASKTFDDVGNLSAQVIFSMGGQEQCAGSPAPWENESLSQITIPLGATKDLILIIGDSPSPSGFWQVISNNRHDKTFSGRSAMAFHSLPLQPKGEMKVRLLNGKVILKTEFFKWRRIYESGDLWLDPIK